MIVLDESEVRSLLRKEVSAYRCGIAEVATKWGVTRGYLYDCLAGRRCPGPSILKRLDLRRATGFVRTRQ